MLLSKDSSKDSLIYVNVNFLPKGQAHRKHSIANLFKICGNSTFTPQEGLYRQAAEKFSFLLEDCLRFFYRLSK